MTAVFAVRHPETTWNVEQRYQGRLESPLSKQGRSQAAILARAFAGSGLEAVISSPLSRAHDLAREIAHQSDAPLLVDQRFTEIGMGAWEGLYRHEIEACYPELYHLWYTHPQEVRFPGGETVSEVRDRVESALGDVFAAYPGGEVAVVTHSAVIQVMAASALHLAFQNLHRVRVSNCSITTFCGSEAPGTLLSLNDTEALYHSPAAAAAAQNCVGWKERRMTA